MAWYDEAVFYHIYPLGLLGAPKENHYDGVTHRLPELDPWIDHIREIGCNAIYIGPLFESEGHGYETTDYRKLDSRLGDNEDLKRFVENCHKAGVRVIFDGVFNHTGRNFFAFRDLKEKREGSEYRDWYCNVNFYGNNEYNDGFSYDNWGGYNLLVKLNQRNPAVRDHICDAIRFWVKEFDIDGIRLDAADVLDFDFMKAQVERFRALGFPVWMDDFGTGYSSLGYLTYIPVEVVKLDKSLVDNYLVDGKDAFINDVIRLVHDLGKKMIVEGVEERQQFERLKAFGADMIQGFYFSKPIPPSEAIRFRVR